MDDDVPEFKWKQEERPETGLPQEEGAEDASRTDGGSGRNSVGGYYFILTDSIFIIIYKYQTTKPYKISKMMRNHIL